MIVPLFALANAGIEIDADLLGDALTSPITLGIVFGYVLGKPLGISPANGSGRAWPAALQRTSAGPPSSAAGRSAASASRWRS